MVGLILFSICIVAVVAYVLIVSKRLRSKMKAWLYVEEHNGMTREIAVISFTDPHIHKSKNGYYISHPVLIGTNRREEYELEQGSINKIIGYTLEPEDPAVPVQFSEISKVNYKEYSSIHIENVWGMFHRKKI